MSLVKKPHAVSVAAAIAIAVWASASSAAPRTEAPSVYGPFNNPSAKESKKTTTFEGSCALEGTVLFEPGVTLVSQPLRYEFSGDGVCTGKLNGIDVSDVSVIAHQYGRSEGSCAQAHTTEPGIGRLTFADGEVLNYTLEFTYQLPETDLTWYGSRSGTARGTGTFRTDRTPPDTTSKCATPAGVTEIPMDISVTTETPLVSGKHDQEREKD